MIDMPDYPLYWDMTIRQIIQARLAQIDCTILPADAKARIIDDFSELAHAKLIALANRHITRAKVAKAFTASQSKQRGVDHLLSLPPQAHETINIAGTPLLAKLSE